MTHPYQNLPPDQYWSSGVSEQAPGLLFPTRPALRKLLVTDRIATMGSCFAQHIGKALQCSGFNFYEAEPPPAWMAADYAQTLQYGVYSARYGNVYTPRQAVQLLTRAFGQFTPIEQCWSANDASGGWVDPFRPTVQAGGFRSEAALHEDRTTHLAAVRKLFTTADWLVLTLGLTEAWQDTRDGAIYPLAPGVAGGPFDAGKHAFINFTADACIADLRLFQKLVQVVNPKARIILTVSPVALAATFEPRHVLTATTYSKAVLRVAAETLAQEAENVSYFPAYEIINSPLSGNRYLADDMRQVNDLGVAHVMRAFFATYLSAQNQPQPYLAKTLAQDMGVVCDESRLDSAQPNPPQAQTASGFDEAAYLAANADVAAAVSQGLFSSAEQHYEQFGRFEGRPLFVSD